MPGNTFKTLVLYQMTVSHTLLVMEMHHNADQTVLMELDSENINVNMDQLLKQPPHHKLSLNFTRMDQWKHLSLSIMTSIITEEVSINIHQDQWLEVMQLKF